MRTKLWGEGLEFLCLRAWGGPGEISFLKHWPAHLLTCPPAGWELSCPRLFLGIACSGSCLHWPLLGRDGAALIRRVLMPNFLLIVQRERRVAKDEGMREILSSSFLSPEDYRMWTQRSPLILGTYPVDAWNPRPYWTLYTYTMLFSYTYIPMIKFVVRHSKRLTSDKIGQ